MKKISFFTLSLFTLFYTINSMEDPRKGSASGSSQAIESDILKENKARTIFEKARDMLPYEAETYDDMKRAYIEAYSLLDQLTDEQVMSLTDSKTVKDLKKKWVQEHYLNPLPIAAYRQDIDFIDFLLENGADPFFRSMTMKNALEKIHEEDELSHTEKKILLRHLLKQYIRFNNISQQAFNNKLLDTKYSDMGRIFAIYEFTWPELYTFMHDPSTWPLDESSDE